MAQKRVQSHCSSETAASCWEEQLTAQSQVDTDGATAAPTKKVRKRTGTQATRSFGCGFGRFFPGASEPLGAEYACPFVKRQVAGHDGGAPFISLAEDLEQQLGAGLRQRHIAEFDDDEQLVAGELALQA